MRTPNRDWLSCHEFGHTVALRHTDIANTCMNSGASGDRVNWRNWESTHEVQFHINQAY